MDGFYKGTPIKKDDDLGYLYNSGNLCISSLFQEDHV